MHLLDKYDKIYTTHSANYVKINPVFFGESEENYDLVQVNRFPSLELNLRNRKMCYSVYRDVGCKWGVRVWSVFMWRRIGHTGGLLMKIVVLRNLRVPQRQGGY